MNNIFKIYKDDIKKIFTNYAALIVFIALSILPSLYAWFNIKASWDPYGKEATSQIKIGVVNKDKGAELKGEFKNIGNQIIDQLKENDVMGWQFVSEKEAVKAVEEGSYYAMITIPEEFSENILSLITDDIKKGKPGDKNKFDRGFTTLIDVWGADHHGHPPADEDRDHGAADEEGL